VAIGTLAAAAVTGLSWRAARSTPGSPTMTAHAAVTLLLGAHMLPHTVQTIALRRRLPGVAGGLAISACPPQLTLAMERDLFPTTWARRRLAPTASAPALTTGCGR
jgi:hypothetical protein